MCWLFLLSVLWVGLGWLCSSGPPVPFKSQVFLLVTEESRSTWAWGPVSHPHTTILPVPASKTFKFKLPSPSQGALCPSAVWSSGSWGRQGDNGKSFAAHPSSLLQSFLCGNAFLTFYVTVLKAEDKQVLFVGKDDAENCNGRLREERKKGSPIPGTMKEWQL